MITWTEEEYKERERERAGNRTALRVDNRALLIVGVSPCLSRRHNIANLFSLNIVYLMILKNNIILSSNIILDYYLIMS